MCVHQKSYSKNHIKEASLCCLLVSRQLRGDLLQLLN